MVNSITEPCCSPGIARSGRAPFDRNAPFTDKSEITDPPISTLGSGWRFPPGAADVIKFNFSGPTYVSARKTSFSYQLTGASEEWRRMGDTRHASFANLKPGHYVFEVSNQAVPSQPGFLFWSNPALPRPQPFTR